jgi:hypothetical protein
MTAPSAPKIDLKKLVLKSGSHLPDGEFCVMEAVAYVAGEKWSDSPECASPSISGFLRCWNDGMNDEDRQMLKPFIPKLVNSRGSDDLEQRRYMLAFNWAIREMVPSWLDAAMLHREASALRDLREFTDPAQLRDVPELSAAGSAARSAAGSAAESALRPTVEKLQKSAFDLVKRMLALKEGTP